MPNDDQQSDARSPSIPSTTPYRSPLFRGWHNPTDDQCGGPDLATELARLIQRVLNAHLIAATPDLLDVAHMVLDTATVETPPALVAAAEAAIRKVGGGA